MCEHLFSTTVFCVRHRSYTFSAPAGGECPSFGANYLPPEMEVTESVAERGFAATGYENDPMVEDPWEDL